MARKNANDLRDRVWTADMDLKRETGAYIYLRINGRGFSILAGIGAYERKERFRSVAEAYGYVNGFEDGVKLAQKAARREVLTETKGD